MKVTWARVEFAIEFAASICSIIGFLMLFYFLLVIYGILPPQI